jgi:hypothetical protein
VRASCPSQEFESDTPASYYLVLRLQRLPIDQTRIHTRLDEPKLPVVAAKFAPFLVSRETGHDDENVVPDPAESVYYGCVSPV